MTKAFVSPDGVYLLSFDGDVEGPEGAIEVPSAPDNALQVWDFVTQEWGPVPDPEPVQTEPVRVACALRVPVVDGEVQQIGGPYRVIGLSLLDVGTFLAIFSQNLGPAEPFVIPNNGVSISIAEWGEDYAIIEIREHADGPLITPASFGFSLYQI